MKLIKKTTIKEIGTEMLTICADENTSYKDSKKRLWDLFIKLRRTKISRESDMKDLIHLHRELSKIKNNKAIFREAEIAQTILVDLPLKINDSEEENAFEIATQLVDYGKEIIASKDDKSKR